LSTIFKKHFVDKSTDIPWYCFCLQDLTTIEPSSFCFLQNFGTFAWFQNRMLPLEKEPTK